MSHTYTPAFAVTADPVVVPDPSAKADPTPARGWTRAVTREECKRRNALLHKAFAGAYTREEWVNAQTLVHAGVMGYRKAVAMVRSTRPA